MQSLSKKIFYLDTKHQSTDKHKEQTTLSPKQSKARELAGVGYIFVKSHMKSHVGLFPINYTQ